MSTKTHEGLLWDGRVVMLLSFHLQELVGCVDAGGAPPLDILPPNLVWGVVTAPQVIHMHS